MTTDGVACSCARMSMDSNFKHRVSANTASRSRGAIRPSFAINFLTLRSEGARKAGCALHPRSRVQNAQRKTHTSIQVQRRQSGFPCAMVLTVSFVLSPVTGLSCHRRLRK
jgi:hypothetical protein